MGQYGAQDLEKQATAVKLLLGNFRQTSFSDPKVLAVYRERMDLLRMEPVGPNPFPPFIQEMMYRTRVTEAKSHDNCWSLVTDAKFEEEDFTNDLVKDERVRLVGLRLGSCLQAPDFEQAKEAVSCCLKAGSSSQVAKQILDKDLVATHIPRVYMLASIGKGMQLSVHARQQKLSDALSTVYRTPLMNGVREFPLCWNITQQARGVALKLSEEAGTFEEIKSLLNAATSPADWVALQGKVDELHASRKAVVGEVITSEKLTALLQRMVCLLCECYANDSLTEYALRQFTQCEGLSVLHKLHETTRHYSEVYTDIGVVLTFKKDFNEIGEASEMDEPWAVRMHTTLASFEKEQQQSVLELCRSAVGDAGADRIQNCYKLAQEDRKATQLEKASKASIKGTVDCITQLLRDEFGGKLQINFDDKLKLERMATMKLHGDGADVGHAVSVLTNLKDCMDELHEMEFNAAAIQLCQAASLLAVERGGAVDKTDTYKTTT